MDTYRSLTSVDAAVEAKHPGATRVNDKKSADAQWRAGDKVVAEAKLTDTGRWRLKVK
jgi:hypothetical protein